MKKQPLSSLRSKSQKTRPASAEARGKGSAALNTKTRAITKPSDSKSDAMSGAKSGIRPNIRPSSKSGAKSSKDTSKLQIDLRKGPQDHKYSGIFLVLEGGDGVGKSTLIKCIQAHLGERSLQVLTTREPGGTSFGEEIRNLLLKDRSVALEALTETFLFQAARVEHVEKVIRPALARGQIVVCDRFTDSTLAFQGGGRGMQIALLEMLNQVATQGLESDLTIWLRLDPLKALARLEARGGTLTHFDREGLDFHTRIHDAFYEQAKRKARKMIVLDASQTPEQIAEELFESPKWKLLIARYRRANLTSNSPHSQL